MPARDAGTGRLFIMKKRFLALLLALAMLTALLAGCGSSSSDSSASSSSSTSSSSSSSDTEEAETAEEAGDTEEEEPYEEQPKYNDETQALIDEAAEAAGAIPASEVDDADKTELWLYVESEDYQSQLNEFRSSTGMEDYMPGSEITRDTDGIILSSMNVRYEYPVEDADTTLTCFSVLRGLVSNYMESNDQLLPFQVAASETGVSIDWTCVSGEMESTQLSLMVASGDYTDIISDFTYGYADTVASAYENDVILALNDYLEDYSPNYYAWINSEDRFLKSVSSDDGNIYAWYSLQPVVVQEQGGWVRSDVLEAYGLDSPVTLEDYTEYFAACKDMGMSTIISAGAVSFAGLATTAFDIAQLTSNDDYSMGYYVVDGEVKASLLSGDAVKDWITQMRAWYVAGYFSSDIVSLDGSDDSNSTLNTLLYNGEVGYVTSGTGHYANFLSGRASEDYELEAARNMVQEDGDQSHFAATYSISYNVGGIVLSTTCADVELACRYLDWFYTDQGIEVMNYGPMGVTWNWSEDGTTREFTAAVYANEAYPDVPVGGVLMLYNGSIAWPTVGDCLYNLYYSSSDAVFAAQTTWAINADSDYYLDETTLAFTVEESEAISDYLSDLTTYESECLLKFLIGDMDIETEWDDFIDTCIDMGAETIVSLYQDAYDRYLSR